MSHYGFSFGTSSIRMSVFFLRLGEFSAVTLCQRNNLPLSLCFSFWEPYNVNVSLCDVSRKYLELSSLFLQSFFFFLFSTRLGWVPLPYLRVCWSFPPLHLIQCWIPLGYFFQFSYCILQHCDLYLVLSFTFYFFIDILTVSIYSFLAFNEHLYDYYLDSLSSKLVISVS